MFFCCYFAFILFVMQSSCQNLNNAKSSSIDPMDDLMEIDFTKKDDDSLSNDSSYDPKHSSCYDLMEIEYPQNANASGIGNSTMYGGGPSEMGRRKKSASISGTLSVKETARVSQPVPIVRRSDGLDSDGYMSMKPVGSSDSKHSTTGGPSLQRGSSMTANSSYLMSSSPTKYPSRPTTIASPAATHRTIPVSRTHQNSIGHDDYLNMSPINVRSTAAGASATTTAKPKVSSQSSQQQQQQQSPLQPLPQQQMHHVGSGSAPDGYMEMSWNNRTQTNNSTQLINNNNNNNNNMGQVTLERNRTSSSSISSSNEYINMNYGGNIPRTSSQSSDCSSTSSIELPTHTIESRNSRLRSLPITIKKSTTQQQSQPPNTVISKHSNLMSSNHPQNHPTVHSFAASKMVPPTFLSLNTNIKPACAQSSLSSDSTSSAAAAAAAAASANSDYSLMAPIIDNASHSNTSSASSTIFPFSPNSPNSGVNKQIFSSQSKQLPCEEQKRKCLVDGTTGKSK